MSYFCLQSKSCLVTSVEAADTAFVRQRIDCVISCVLLLALASGISNGSLSWE